MGYTILGGRIAGPVDLSIEGQLPVPLETVTANVDSALKRRLPGIPRLSCVGKHLAVVGGGPSINAYLDEIRAIDADIWAVNGAWRWCHENGIDATFFAVDPHPIVLNWPVAANGTKASRAILSVACDPAVFDLLADAEVIGLAQGAEDIRGGSSTASLAPHLAAVMGYSSVTLYGCESSYPIGRSHAYQHEIRDQELIIVSDGQEHLTAPDFMMQANELATFIAELPDYLIERSGGLLRAMVNDKRAGREHSIKWISQGMADGLKNIKPKGQPCGAEQKLPERVEFAPQDTGAGVLATPEQLATTRFAAE